jgi:hypothetical protein
MNKSVKFTIGIACSVFCTAFILNTVSAQTAQKDKAATKPIPADVLKVAEKSCVKCHTEPGNKMALSMVNLSYWDKYSPEKQASKANTMCKMVTKGKMPPKSYRKEHPDGLPTKDDIKIICDWAASLQMPKK